MSSTPMGYLNAGEITRGGPMKSLGILDWTPLEKWTERGYITMAGPSGTIYMHTATGDCNKNIEAVFIKATN